jgi:hypothetical protein
MFTRENFNIHDLTVSVPVDILQHADRQADSDAKLVNTPFYLVHMLHEILDYMLETATYGNFV